MGGFAAAVQIAIALGRAQPAPPPDDAAPPAAASRGAELFIEVLIVRAPTPGDLSAVGTALRVRLPQRTIDDGSAPRTAEGGTSFAFVDVREGADGGYAITIVLPDGRAFDRAIEPADGDFPAREVASIVAHMVATIERGEMAPDRTDATIPTPPDEREREREREREPPPPALPRPVEVYDGPVEEPRLWAGPWLRSAAALGVGPLGAGPPFVGAGAEIGASLIHRRGGLGSLAVRGLWVRGDGATVHRIRVALGGGYRWARRGADIRIAAAATVEPWLVTERGAQPSLAASDGGQATAPLVGGLIRVVPGYRWAIGQRAALRVGAHVEVAGSAAARGGGGVVVLRRPARDPVSRLGGAELDVGLVLGLERAVMGSASAGTSGR